ncbi:MAG: CDP-diacylglycerol--glycerol-3-phosphate 3-phosphatidyltransferase [Gemmatimonadetes bacterium]|nr:CDP-alcohol phosphatidyltransferase family protein [Gemmatimonadota bacterium]MYA12301.1 CDP-diacylglycerol--glycerol-3-phosphate 3-phosphatidyltransferase [Gemmatimonadota bacterium]MYE69460.1 CDP-diacylglycerol--glycerol-3-phosphate 3-phosphatidyltransferase [Gemmatimonadota bacterium]MYJ67265.1 CDP-diacylglycerol--glycerol-3-phosphate 3-phosphatidyltransferase [Gemmatimonadota bacterium]
MNIPNAITAARIAMCPVIPFLALSDGVGNRYAAFLVFLLAALTDIWDGQLARRYGWVTDTGKLLDPLADKLLLVCTFVPLYMISHRTDELGALPWWGAMPLWVVLVIFGREALVTSLRGYAVRRGIVIAAGKSGKLKTLALSVFTGAALLWYPLAATAADSGWSGGPWELWLGLHGALIGVTLGLSVLLSLFSMADYLWRHRSLASRS